MTAGKNLGNKNLEPKMGTKSSGTQSTRMRRRNFSFRKMLTPRSACQVLGDLLGHLPFKDFVQCERVTDSKQGQISVFLARIEYDGGSFESLAGSKSAAENDCSEKVLMYLTAKSCQEDEEKKEEVKGETNIPWVPLASLALFNMFNRWEMQGCVLPRSITRQQKDLKSRNIGRDEDKSVEVAKDFEEEPTVRSPPIAASEALLKPDQFDGEATFEQGTTKRLDNMKGVTKVSFENVQPVKEVYLREENSETKTEHVRTDMKARQTDKSEFSQRGFPTQKSPSSRSKLPSSWPTVPDFELRWKHPITLLNDLAGPRLDFIEVPFSVQLILTIRNTYHLRWENEASLPTVCSQWASVWTVPPSMVRAGPKKRPGGLQPPMLLVFF